MKPIKFKEQNVVFAENQPEYLPLPAFKAGDDNGTVVFCMKLSFIERVRLLFTGKLWCSLLTFNKPLTPSFFTTRKTEILYAENKWLTLWVVLKRFRKIKYIRIYRDSVKANYVSGPVWITFRFLYFWWIRIQTSI